ncbi:MAG: 6,7-dimethyl-8-ribityllumazine synthase [Bacteroidaceae bacterium]|nr:6,7-dimethyl-8-ribityllumazine synthase [Bacteroidaceae bacterium]
MASALHNLSSYDPSTVPDGSEWKIGIVVSEWNEDVTGALLQGAYDTLLKHGVQARNIIVKTVPGSFELVYGSAWMARQTDVDAVIAIGCVIRGDTPHFDYICQGTTQGLAELNRKAIVPVIYGLLTCNTLQQALDRCGGALGNKGDECAVTALKMIQYGRNS